MTKKILICGEHYSGKSTFMDIIMKRDFYLSDPVSIISVNYENYYYNDTKNMIYDVGISLYQKKYQHIIDTYIDNDIDIYIIFFDISKYKYNNYDDNDTNDVYKWYDKIIKNNKNNNKKYKIIIIGNKLDMIDYKHYTFINVKKQIKKITTFCFDNNIFFYLISCKKDNIDDISCLFNKIII